MQAWHRKLFQINDSATTVDAAPLAASANATSTFSPSSGATSSKPQTILGDIISDFKNKVNGTDATPAATSAPASSASAAASAADVDATPPFQYADLSAEGLTPNSVAEASTSSSSPAATPAATSSPQSGAAMYSPPCEASPEPTAYEAFTGVSAFFISSLFMPCYCACFQHAILVCLHID